MSMYDYIDIVIKCPNCSSLIDRFQSKDGNCMMENLKYYEVSHFYSACHECKKWIDVYINPEFKIHIPTDQYIVEVDGIQTTLDKVKD